MTTLKRLFTLFSFCCTTSLFSQEKIDSSKQLDNIIIKGYESNAMLLKVPASIAVIGKSELSGLSNASLLPAVNSVSGIKMEERSPGSYRLSIRGSLLRSPFGIRNVKVYYDDFIFTDAGGNTYLNLLDINNVNALEIIKGPAGSLYGAGTGGAVLLSGLGNSSDSNDLRFRISGGSFGTLNESIQYLHQSKHIQLSVGQSHLQSKGYRMQSGMRKDNFQLNMKIKSTENVSTDFFMLYTDLYYQTPGGLTLAQFNANPRQSRPATPTLPSVIDQKTAIYNKTAFIGFSNTYRINKHWKTVSSVSNSITGFKNPFITNYEKRRELNIGLRSKLVYENNAVIPVQWVSGFEIQKGDYHIDSSGNNKGVPDANKVTDEIIAKQQFAFTQLNIHPLSFLHIQTGFSINRFFYTIERTIGNPSNGKKSLDFNRQLLPRIAMLLDPLKHVSIYAQLSKGYSSPTIAEVRPSAGGLYSGLQAEYGWNKEVGFKAVAMRNKFSFNAALFQYYLKNAIVRRVNAAGAEYFLNEGNVQQKGIEIDYQFTFINQPQQKFLQSLKWSQAFTFNDFRFINYKNNLTSYAGNKLTGVADKVFVTNVNAAFARSFYWNFQFSYVDKMPLNDANTFFSDAYRLCQSKLGWKSSNKKYPLECFVIIDNIGNEQYSLGYDINAFGNRFFNPSPTRNVQVGIIVDLK